MIHTIYFVFIDCYKNGLIPYDEGSKCKSYKEILMTECLEIGSYLNNDYLC